MFIQSEYRRRLESLKELSKDYLGQVKIDPQQFLQDNFFEKQREYIIDTTSYITSFGGRRIGKSVGNAGKIVWFDEFVQPHKPGYIVYASTTVHHAKRLALRRLMEAQKAYQLNWKPRLSLNEIVMRNNILQFAGLKDLQSVYNLQGIPIKLAIIDEPQFIRNDILETFIREIVSYGKLEFGGEAVCALTGNPFPHHVGYLYDLIFKQEGVKRYTWSIYDNTHFDKQDIENFIDEELKVRGLERGKESAEFKRLMYGEWAKDDGNLVLPFSEKNYYSELPSGTFINILGIDIGWHHHTALSMLRYNPVTKEVFLTEEYRDAKMTAGDIAGHIRRMKASLPASEICCQVMDTQGGGKTTAETISAEHGIPIIPAKKAEKMAAVRRIKDFVTTGKLKILNKEGQTTQLETDAGHIVFTHHGTAINDDVKSGYHSDQFFSVLYGLRYIIENYMSEEIGRKQAKETDIQRKLRSIKESQNSRLLGSEFDDIVD